MATSARSAAGVAAQWQQSAKPAISSSAWCHHLGVIMPTSQLCVHQDGVNQSTQLAVHTQAQCEHITCSFAASASPTDHLYLLKHNVSASRASSWCQEVRPDHLQVPRKVSSPPPGSRMSSNPVYLVFKYLGIFSSSIVISTTILNL